MKKIRIILLVALVLVVGLPPVFGMLTESAVRARVESLREERRLQITLDEYERSWFTSRALLSIEPTPSDDSAGVTLLDVTGPMRVVVDFRHGPVAVQDGLFLGFTDMLARRAASVRDVTDSVPFDFQFRAQTTFGGNMNFVGEIMPFDATADGGEISFSGGRVHGTLAGTRTQAQLDADALQYTRAAMTVSLLGMQASMDNERVSQYVLPGSMTLRVDRMSMDLGASAPSTVFDLRALDAEASTALDAAREHLRGALRIDVERLVVGSETEVTGAQLAVAAEQLEVAAFEAYMDAVARAAANDATVGDEIEPAERRLLAGGPTATVDALRFAVNGEPVEATGRATADGDALPPPGTVSFRDVGLWMAVLDGHAEIAVAKPLAEQVAAAIAISQLGGRIMAGEPIPADSIEAMARAQAGLAIALLAAQGLLEDTGSLYRTTVQLEDGRLTINGQSLPFFGLP